MPLPSLKSVYDLKGLEVVQADWTTFEEVPWILKETQGDRVMGLIKGGRWAERPMIDLLGRLR